MKLNNKKQNSNILVNKNKLFLENKTYNNIEVNSNNSKYKIVVYQIKNVHLKNLIIKD